MITIYLAQTFRPSRFRDGAYVPAQGAQFATLGEALLMGRAAVALGQRADVSRVSGDPSTDMWDEPVLLKRLRPAEKQPGSTDEGAAPETAINKPVEVRRLRDDNNPDERDEQISEEDGARVVRLQPHAASLGCRPDGSERRQPGQDEHRLRLIIGQSPKGNAERKAN